MNKAARKGRSSTVAPYSLLPLLLLLLLLLVGSYRWTAHQRGARANYEGRGCGLGWCGCRRGYGDGYTEFALGFAFVDAARWRDVGVVAADGDANVAIAADQIVRRIERDPAQARDQRFDPGVRRAFERAILFLFIAMKHVSADIAARDVEDAAPARS